MIIREIRIKGKYFPPTSVQDAPATQEEITNVRKFIVAVEKAAEKYIYKHRGTIKIKEIRETEI